MRRLILSLIATAPLGVAAAQSLPPVRQLPPVVARSSEPLGAVSTVYELPGGKLLVNDILRRRVVLFDSTFSSVTVVADSTSSTANAYGGRAGGLLAFRADSALFVDPASLSMLVIDPTGKIGRVMSAPRPTDVMFLLGGPNGTPGFDSRGRLIYRGLARGPAPDPRAQPNGPMGMVLPNPPDSAPVVRIDLETRKLDTVAFFKVEKRNMTVTQTPNGGFSVTSTVNPMPIVDDWALLSDGTVAIVRGSDYHVEWVSPDGSRTSSPKIPYEWQRLDDDAKIAVLDSARAAIEKQRELARANIEGGRGAGAAQVLMGGPGGGGRGGDVVVFGGGTRTMPAPPPRDTSSRRGGAAGAAGTPSFQIPPVNMVPANELPDYRPAFSSGAALGDLEGNLWIRTTSPVGNEGPIYFVIDRKGEVIDRVQLPQGRQLAGFGRNGVLYLSLRDAEGNARVEKARAK
jgi:hypothetical protein